MGGTHVYPPLRSGACALRGAGACLRFTPVVAEQMSTGHLATLHPIYPTHTIRKEFCTMAIFHCSIKLISRSSGRSAVATSAYRSGEKLLNMETGITHDFTRKGGVYMSEIILPANAPARYQDRQTLWNEVQQVEKRNDAQLAREVEVSLPIEMAREEQIECVRAYIKDNFTSKGMIADWALHDKGDGNPHAHIMLSVRELDADSKWINKRRSVFANARDDQGRPIYDPAKPSYDPADKENTSKYRIPVLDENGNQKTRERKGKGTEYLWERISIPTNDWNEHSKAEEWRRSWAEHCNRYLAPDNQIDHRSYKRQGLDIEPTIHEGVTARQMEQSGNVSDRCEINREIKERNLIRAKIKKLAAELTQLIIGKVRDLYERITGIRKDKELRGADRDIETSGGYRNADGGTGNRDQGTEGGTHRETVTDTGTDGGAGRDTEYRNNHSDRESEIEGYAESIRRTESEITATDKRIKELKSIRAEKEAELNERIRKLMEHRTTGSEYGTDAGANGKSATLERNASERKSGASGYVGEYETETLIRDIQNAISHATITEEIAGADRANREAEQSRLNLERQREAEAGKRADQERETEHLRKSRGRGTAR